MEPEKDASSKRSGWFSSFRRSDSDNKPKSSTSSNTPKGIFLSPSSISIGAYIWGDPGSGKSMMMDILYESIPKTIPKKRVHFHAFMLDIHQRLHAYRKIHGILSRTMYHKQVLEVIPSLKLLKKSDKNSRSCALMNSKYLTTLFILLHR